MYLKIATLTNLKCISAATIEWTAGHEAGWHILLGDNGSGKSGILKAISIGLIGPKSLDLLRVDSEAWIRFGSERARIELEVLRDSSTDFWNKQGKTRSSESAWIELNKSGVENSQPSAIDAPFWDQETEGWFSAGFGPFRRFTGGDTSLTKLFYSHPRLGRHLSLHGEDVALTETVEWLRQIYVRELEQRVPEERSVVSRVRAFISRVLGVEGYTLAPINSEGVFFSTPTIERLRIQELSDGLRSILSMSLEIIRQASLAYHDDALLDSEGNTPITGVVLIDEIDVHLHPSWQALIGEKLKSIFPRIQFIVSTHSPLVCQSADTIWRLETGDGATQVRQLQGTEFETTRNGSIQEALGLTEAFGIVRERSPEGSARLRKAAESAYSDSELDSLRGMEK
ncbi:MAG: AAA family ATPase [Spirochaetota bacterium]